jgi:signal transduction histidine kinase
MTDINDSIEKAIDLSMATLRKSGIQIEKSLLSDLPYCYTDSQLIEQVILNLLTNAAQALKQTDGEKKIGIATALERNQISITVADSGPGIPSTLEKKIFDPFFTTKPDSSGIGLSLCQRIITDHGGTLTVHKSKWGGAEFRVEIPIEKRRQTA